MKEMMIDSNAKLIIQNIDEKLIISYKIMDEQCNYFDFNFILSDDINIIAYTDDDLKNELLFTIKDNNPLYNPFLNFLKKDEKIRITSDYVREEYDNLCYVEIKKDDNSIIIKFVNEISNTSSINKFNYVIINRMFDLRSKLDQNDTEYKKRLLNLFNDIILIINNKEKNKQLTLTR